MDLDDGLETVVAGEESDEEDVEEMERKLVELQREAERQKARLAAAKAERELQARAALKREAETLEKEMEDDAKLAADLRAKLEELEEASRTAPAVDVEEKLFLLEKERSLESMALLRIEMEELAATRAELERSAEAQARHLEGIVDERERRGRQDEKALDDILAHVDSLAKELASGDYDKREIATRLADGDPTLRLGDELAAVQRRREEAEKHRLARELRATNEQRRELAHYERKLARKKKLHAEDKRRMAAVMAERARMAEAGELPPQPPKVTLRMLGVELADVESDDEEDSDDSDGSDGDGEVGEDAVDGGKHDRPPSSDGPATDVTGELTTEERLSAVSHALPGMAVSLEELRKQHAARVQAARRSKGMLAAAAKADGDDAERDGTPFGEGSGGGDSGGAVLVDIDETAHWLKQSKEAAARRQRVRRMERVVDAVASELLAEAAGELLRQAASELEAVTAVTREAAVSLICLTLAEIDDTPVADAALRRMLEDVSMRRRLDDEALPSWQVPPTMLTLKTKPYLPGGDGAAATGGGDGAGSDDDDDDSDEDLDEHVTQLSCEPLQLRGATLSDVKAERSFWRGMESTALHIDTPAAVALLATHGAGRLLAVADTRGTISVYDLSHSEALPLRVWKPAERRSRGPPRCIEWSADGSRLVSVDVLHATRVFDAGSLDFASVGSADSWVPLQMPVLKTLLPLDFYRPGIDGSDGDGGGKGLPQDAMLARFHAAFTLFGTQPSILIGLRSGLIVKYNLPPDAPLLGQGIVARDVVLAEGRGGTGSEPEVLEFLQSHHHAIVFLGGVHHRQQVVSVDDHGYIALWKYDHDHLSSFGWFVPDHKCRVQTRISTFLSVDGSRQTVFPPDGVAVPSVPEASPKFSQLCKDAAQELDAIAGLQRVPWYRAQDGSTTYEVLRPTSLSAMDSGSTFHHTYTTATGLLVKHEVEQFVAARADGDLLQVLQTPDEKHLVLLLAVAEPPPRGLLLSVVKLRLADMQLEPWRIDLGLQVKELPLVHIQPGMPPHSDDILFAASGASVRLYSLRTGQAVGTIPVLRPGKSGIVALAAPMSGRRLAVGGGAKKLFLYRLHLPDEADDDGDTGSDEGKAEEDDDFAGDDGAASSPSGRRHRRVSPAGLPTLAE